MTKGCYIHGVTPRAGASASASGGGGYAERGARSPGTSRALGVASLAAEEPQKAAWCDAELGELALRHLDRRDVRPRRRVPGAVGGRTGETRLHVGRRDEPAVLGEKGDGQGHR